MRLRARTWMMCSVLLFAAAYLTWRHAEELRLARRPVSVPVVSVRKAMAPVQPGAPLLARIPILVTNPVLPAKNKATYRVSNTVATLQQLERMDRAILLRNALIDTALPLRLNLPAHLHSTGDPGSYLVKADRALDPAFYAALSAAGAEFISYIPNNTALVSATPAVAQVLRQSYAVMAYEPYFKLNDNLLSLAAPDARAGTTNLLSIGVVKSKQDEAIKSLQTMGATILARDRNPFGTTLIAQASAVSLSAIANLPSVLEIETTSRRTSMNDLTRARLKIAANTQTATNWLGLTGTNIMVSLNDTGVDATHPDFDTRISGLNTDFDGHGTHVAGIIAGSGLESGTVTKASGSVFPIATNQFRGMAPGARLFVQGIDTLTGALFSDGLLQETASKTNAFISNNSWGYVGSYGYSLAAASYDAAVRDAQPDVTGSQPMLFVFAAGNDGQGSDNGQNGQADTIGSPAAGKNVVTVGATESPRNITNEVSFDGTTTNAIFAGITDSRTDIAYFSSRGNVGIGVEGDFGRFKPDVVAPGVFIVSTRATNYVDPTNFETFTANFIPNQAVLPAKTNDYPLVVTSDTIAIIIEVFPNPQSPNPFPTNIPILLDPAPLSTTKPATFRGDNVIIVTNGLSAGNWVFGVVNPDTNHPLALDIATFLVRTNALGDYFQVLSNLNNGLRPYYRYESGTSMAAPAVTGTLALMQEYLTTRLNPVLTNPSPALMKAMLINGARSLSSFYDYPVHSGGANDQGWGLVNISNSLPLNMTGPTGGSMQFFDQDTNNVLTTGQSQTRTLHFNDVDAQAFPLRVTLVWTDPPGNPAASLKLVNDLDLIVSNNLTGDVFIGNNFPGGDVFTTADTNAPSDLVNNVENVYISTADQPLDSDYTIIVKAKRINVNAVTAVTNGIAQDYALVISSGDATSAGPFSVTPAVFDATNSPPITFIDSGVPQLNQRVGANSPLLATTNGSFEQWHFFVMTNALTNSASFTNVAFVTFFPPNLSRPRNTDADIDLYVSTNPALFTLNAAVIAAADKSLNRGGSEAIIYTNSAPGDVYYIGVKSEDQEASEFGFYGLATDQAIGSGSGSNTDPLKAYGLGVPINIPDGSFDSSHSNAIVLAAMIVPPPTTPGQSFQIRKVVVEDTLFHENMGDLFGQLTLNDKIPVVLNNHSSAANPVTHLQALTYDDLPEDPSIPTVHPDGPGTLKDYVGEPKGNAGGGILVWMLTETDNALTQTGRVDALTITAYPSPPTNSQFQVTLPPCGDFFNFVVVPDDGTNLTITVGVVSGSGPVEIRMRKGDFPDPNVPATWDIHTTNAITAPGGSLSLGTNNVPPLTPGLWFYDLHNDDCSSPLTLNVLVHVDEAIVPDLTETFYNTNATPLLDDAITRSTIFVPNHGNVVDAQVGVRIDVSRVSDLSLRLLSPQGTSVLLFENRGGLGGTNFGLYPSNFVYTTFTENTNLAHQIIKFAQPPFASSNALGTNNIFTNDFETVGATNYTNGQIIEGWLVATNQVAVVSDPNLVQSGTNFLVLANGAISRSFPTQIGRTYQLTHLYRGSGITNWWTGNGNPADILSSQNGTPTTNVVYLDAEVNRGFKFDGTNSTVVFTTNAGNFGTNDFSLEFWFRTSTIRTQEAVMEKSIGCVTNLSLLKIRLGSPTFSTGILNFALGGDGGSNYSSAVFSTNAVNDGLLHHAALVRSLTNVFCYIDGQLTGSTNTPGIADLTNNAPFEFGKSGCSGQDGTTNFSGTLDEVTFFNRALNAIEVNAIYRGGIVGKATTVSILPNFNLLLNNSTNSTNAFVGAMGGPWLTNSFAFVATSNNATITLQGNPLGVFLDRLKVDALPLTNIDNYFYPEESLDAFIGENGFGNWILEVSDTRAGDTNTTPVLLGWNLDLTLSSTNVQLVILTNGVAYTNGLIASNGIIYFSVDAPPMAAHATNTMFSLTNTGQVNLLFNQTALPTGGTLGDYSLLNNVGIAGGTNLLVINSPAPTFLPGKRYFLGVQNTTGVPQPFSLEVQFDVTTNLSILNLTNGLQYSTNIASTNLYQYYSFDVPTNAAFATFQVINPTPNVDLMVRHTVPLPNVQSYDYLSANSGTNYDAIVVITNSSPVSLTSGRWYLAVYNAGGTNSSYTVFATYTLIGAGRVIAITTNQFVPGISAPGFPTNFFYSFLVTNTPAEVVFDVTGVNGNVDMVVRLNNLPTPQRSDRGSFNKGSTSEIIGFNTNADYPNLNGIWYIAIPNNSGSSANYTLHPSTGLGGGNFPAFTSSSFNAVASSFSLNWGSVPSQNYAIDLSTNLPVWSPLTNITATTTNTTFTDPDAVTSHKLRYYRLRVLP